VANLPKEARGQLFSGRVEGRFGKIKHCWNGVLVSALLLPYCQVVSHCLTLAWFRLFVGDLSNDVSDDVLANAFNKYTSFQKARVIRDRLSQKVIPCFLSSLYPRFIVSFSRPSMVLLLSLIQKIS